jgi:hypothetical protein
LPRLDRRAKEARWVAALERAGVLVEIENIERARLPKWIGERLARQKQHAGARGARVHRRPRRRQPARRASGDRKARPACIRPAN